MENYIVKELVHYCNVNLPKCLCIEESVIDFYDFTFMLEGKMEYMANGEKIIINKNDAIFLPPGTLRSRTPSDIPVKYVSFNFTVFDGIDFSFDKHLKDVITGTIKKLPELYPYSHLIDDNYSRKKCSNMLNYILLELMDNCNKKNNNSHIEKILKYIDTNIISDISFSDICKVSGLSREYTSSLFKKEVGVTITDYINQKKMQIAKELIMSREMPLKDVCEYVGYNNYNYFSRLFKKTFENKPTAFKNNKKRL